MLKDPTKESSRSQFPKMIDDGELDYGTFRTITITLSRISPQVIRKAFQNKHSPPDAARNYKILYSQDCNVLFNYQKTNALKHKILYMMWAAFNPFKALDPWDGIGFGIDTTCKLQSQ